MSATSRRSQRGIGAAMAVVLIAMAAVLAGAALVLATVQQTTIAADLQGSRAYQAARGGVEWAAHNVLRPGAPDCADLAAGITFSYAGALTGFHVTVSCVQSAHEDPNPISVFAITATGCSALSAGRCDPAATPTSATYAERQLRAVLTSN